MIPGDSFSFRPKIELARKDGHIAGLKEALAFAEVEPSDDSALCDAIRTIRSRIASLQQEG